MGRRLSPLILRRVEYEADTKAQFFCDNPCKFSFKVITLTLYFRGIILVEGT